jgi:hypothetical protein
MAVLHLGTMPHDEELILVPSRRNGRKWDRPAFGIAGAALCYMSGILIPSFLPSASATARRRQMPLRTPILAHNSPHSFQQRFYRERLVQNRSELL